MPETTNRRELSLILLAALLLAFARSPILLLKGRVVAEEGSVYFQKAWDAPSLDALLAIHQGYYSLFMNGVSLLAEKLVPVERLGLVYTSVSLLVLLLTVYLAATCELFADSRSRWMAAGIVMLTPAIEVWLTAEDMQFYLPVCVALICISSEHRHKLVRSGTLLLAGLSGPTSLIFTPFLILRAYQRRSAWAIAQASILSACSLVQGLVIWVTLHTGVRTLSDATKWNWFGAIVFIKIFAVTFFGRLGAFLCQRICLRYTNEGSCLFFWGLCLLSVFFFWKAAGWGGKAARICLSMALLSLIFNYSGIEEPLSHFFIGAFRYFFTGFVLLWFIPVLIYSEAKLAQNFRRERLGMAFCLLVLCWGAIDAVGYWTRFQKLSPDWQTQVAAWRRNPATPISATPVDPPYQLHLHPH